MKNLILTAFVITICAVAISQNIVFSHEGTHAEDHSKLKLENLRTDKLAGVENTEVVVSRVVIPPNTTLSKHWHPGEEFAYIIEGSVTLWQEGNADIVGKQGDVIKVPLKQVHTAITKETGATIVVFRVHELGKQQRYLVE